MGHCVIGSVCECASKQLNYILDTKVAFTLLRFTQYASLFLYMTNIFASLKLYNLLRKLTRVNGA